MKKIILTMVLAVAATNINAQLVVDSIGRVGIGTETPKSLLSVGTPGDTTTVIQCNVVGKKHGMYILNNSNADDVLYTFGNESRVKNNIGHCVGGSGRGVYRIQLDEKKKQKTRQEQLFFENRKMKWYLDRQSLRLTQVNGVRHDDEHLSIYRNDFGEENGAPVLTKATKISYFDNRIMKTTIRLIDK